MRLSPRRLRWPVPIFSLILVGYWATALFMISVDPLDLYPWGLTPKRAPGLTVSAHEDLLPGLIKDPTVDLLLVGGSTTGAYTSDQLRAWIPGVENPANLSYNSPRPGDNALVLGYIERHSKARRVIVVYNTYYTEKLGAARPSFETFLLTDKFGDGLRALSPHVVALALDLVKGEPLYANSGGDAAALEKRREEYRRFQTRAAMDDLAAVLERGRPALTEAAPQDCAAYPAVTEQLAPFARRMAARGVRVDIMMPAYSTAMYAAWRANPPNVARFGSNLFERDLAARRCVVEQLDGTPGVRVVSFDAERWITDDLANYHDTTHLFSPRAAQFIFNRLDSDAYRLTGANVGGYIADLRRRALSYQPYNSVLRYGRAS